MKRYAINSLSIWIIFFFPVELFSKEIIIEEKESYKQELLQQNEAVIQWARTHLPQTGILAEEKDGFVYVKVNDDYIKQLFFKIPHFHYVMPPYFRRSDSLGAHISVFYADERRRTGRISEIGETYSFTIIGLDVVPSHTQEYVILKVKSLDLEHLREKYGLSPLLKNHEFHITIAKKSHMRRNPY